MWQRQEINPEVQSHTLRLPDALCLMEEYECEHVALPGGGSGEALFMKVIATVAIKFPLIPDKSHSIFTTVEIYNSIQLAATCLFRQH
jgi:hypothetical protein